MSQSKMDFKKSSALEKDVSWVKDRSSGSGYTFFSNPVAIDASIDTVWEVVKDVEHYKEFSHGAVEAEVDGPVEMGKTIKLDMYPEECKGALIPQSKEMISIVDPVNKIIGWEREVPLTNKPTERYQVLEPISEKQTNSYIGLRIRGGVGFFTELFLKNIVESSFTALNNGIKAEAEKRCHSVAYVR